MNNSNKEKTGEVVKQVDSIISKAIVEALECS
jgi:hypothetical protein